MLVAQAICGTTGSISGLIKDAAGSPVAGARITLTNSGTGIKQNVTSGRNGSYRFPNVLPGDYELQTEAKNFKPQSRKGLVVHVDGAIRINVTLEADSTPGN
jgi:protocatechuate 3,4-dioxygenase beta subunit